MTLHPTRVFEAPEYPREQAVIVAAEKMLETWERLVGSVQWRGMVEQSDAAVFAGQVVFVCFG